MNEMENPKQTLEDAPAMRKYRIFRRQPILCPWITTQPYSSHWCKNSRPSTSDKLANTNNDYLENTLLSRSMPNGKVLIDHKHLPTVQPTSSQFFYFLRLMQLFPETHPATIHSVLSLCQNDFYSAVDKLLYAKKCKMMACKRNLLLQTNKLPMPQHQHQRTGNNLLNVYNCCRDGNNISSSVSTQNKQTRHCWQQTQQQQHPAKVKNEAQGSLNLSTNYQYGDNNKQDAKLQEKSRTAVFINSFVDKAEDLSAMKNIDVDDNQEISTEILDVTAEFQ